VDTWLEDGLAIPPFYDSLIAKVVVWDAGRPEAIARMRRALEELEVTGIPTTREVALDVLASHEFGSGDYSTSTLAALEGRAPSLSPA
jgi:acetyl-CoA carboxylase biotin carboxylase subunit